MNQIETITTELLDKLIVKARENPRKRHILTLHRGAWEHAHRMLNAMTPDTYVTPHQHSNKYKGEGFIVLRGKIAVLIFNDKGEIDTKASKILAQKGSLIGIDMQPGTWHSIVALEDSVLYEVKGQPNEGYVEDTDKEFAQWAPREGSEEANDYLKKLEEAAKNIENTSI